MIRALLISASLVVLAACSGGGYSAGSGGGGGGVHMGGPPPVNVTTIDISLVNHGPSNTPFGMSTGYSPAVTNLSVGSLVQFHNSDGFAHTATSISGSPAQFPAADPFSNAALTQSGGTLSGGFSSGALNGGATSQMLQVDKAGTFLFGCFFHYASAGMRAAIVAT